MTTLEYGEVDSTMDIGLFEVATIGDYVWEDLNGNGIQDETDTGIPGVPVVVRGMTGNNTGVTDTTQTDSTGHYHFTNLVPGVYELSFAPPIEYQIISERIDIDDSINSDVDTNGVIMAEIINGSETNLNLDAGLFQFGTIGNLAWEDLNANGIQDEGEPGLAAVTVHLNGLTGTGDTISETVLTDTDGNYLFSELPPGNYTIEMITPDGYIATLPNAGLNDTLDSDVDTLSQSQTLIISGGEDLTHDGGFYQLGSIGDLAWIDTNADGLQDENEAGMAGVLVTLAGEDGQGNLVNATLTTDSLGNYCFDNLIPGTYQISFELPENYTVTSRFTGTNNELDNNANETGIVETIVLLSNEDNKQIDLGLVPDFDLALVIQLAPDQDIEVNQADTVNIQTIVINQGIADAYDINIINYVPEDFIFDNSINADWATDATYELDVLPAGDTAIIPIKLVVDMDLMDTLVMDTSEISFATRVTNSTINAMDIDSEFDAINTDIIGEDNGLTNHAGDEDDHDFVFVADLQDVDPIGYLYGAKSGRIIRGGTISVQTPPGGIAMIIMDGSKGMYQWFTNGVPGVYTMSYNHPLGYQIDLNKPALVGPYDPTGRDGATEDMDGEADNGMVQLGTIDVSSDSLYLLDTDFQNNPYYLDFFLESGDPIVNANNIPIRESFIGSIVCEDENSNGLPDEGEPGLADAIVYLYLSADTLNPIDSFITDADGNYRFDGLVPERYMVQFIPPADHRPSVETLPLSTITARDGYSEIIDLTMSLCDTTTTHCFSPCPIVSIDVTDATLKVGESVELTATGGPHYQWSPSTGLDCDTCETVTASPVVPTVYTVNAQDDYGCSDNAQATINVCLLYTSPSPRDRTRSRMPSSA